MQAASIFWASERGLGPGNFDWWAPNRLDAISQGPKKSQFPGLNPLPLALVMPASKALCIGPYKSQVHK